MIRPSLASALIVPVVLLGLAAPVLAADPPPKADIGISYSVLHNDAGTYPLGWVFAAGANITNSIAVVGEIAGNYKTIGDLEGDATIMEHAFLGGVRFAHRTAHPATPFVQLLVGASNFHASGPGFSNSASPFAVQTGGGVDIKMRSAVALRVQGDYRWSSKDGYHLDEFRFAVGLVFGAGKR